jgi:hypothetical protein
MFRELTSQMQYPPWAGTAEKPARWRRLDQLDKVLSGTIYDHIVHDFYQETLGDGGDAIPIRKRRPSSRYGLPMMIARWSSRKLWAGRHVPRIRHKDKKITQVVDQIIHTADFFGWMMTATILGSVGSVAMTFRVDNTEPDEPQVGFRVWKSRDCSPKFDDFGNLVELRIHLVVTGQELLDLGIPISRDGNPVNAAQKYWWFRLYTRDTEATLVPARADDWNPVQKWTRPGLSDVPMPDGEVRHDLGFVPGVWFKNLSGSTGVDGRGTWETSVDNSIEIDYLLSQVSRGCRYNCAPRTVVVGTIEHDEADYIHLKASTKDQEGSTTGGGEAELLEMTGQGVKAALEQIDKLRNMTLESIGATRKDPEKLKGVMSGAAMQFMDEESHDTVMELRNSYGRGALELMRKVVRATGATNGADPKGLTLAWPRLYQPTPEDLAHLIPALVLAATPIQEPLDPETAAKISDGPGGAEAGETVKDGGGGGAGQQEKKATTKTHKSATGASHTVKEEVTKGPGTAGGRPSAQPAGGKILGALLELEEASEYLKLLMDISLMPDDETEHDITDSDAPTDTAPPPTGTNESPLDQGGGRDIEIPPSP